ncbi:hypothetical protein DSM104299_05107 [Baekduia alba]|nr:hypothetical protein DSM104299_05107 [Baekduia alba]
MSLSLSHCIITVNDQEAALGFQRALGASRHPAARRLASTSAERDARPEVSSRTFLITALTVRLARHASR